MLAVAMSTWLAALGDLEEKGGKRKGEPADGRRA